MTGLSTYKILNFKDLDNSSNDYENYLDLEINKNKFRPEISLIIDNNKKYKIPITEATKCEFNDRLYKINVNCAFSKSNIEFTFDRNDWSSYKIAKEQLNELKAKKFNYIYYDNGRIKYIGETIPLQEMIEDNSLDQYKSIKSVAHGLGTQYFNSEESKVQYTGSFENGIFQGKGTLHSYDGRAFIECNNFTSGYPSLYGKIGFNLINNSDFISADQKSKLESIDFDNIQDKFDLNEFFTFYRNYDEFVLSHDYIKSIISYILVDINYDFDTLSDKEKIKSLNNKVKNLEKKVDEFKGEIDCKYNLFKDRVLNISIALCGVYVLKNIIF